MTSEVDDDDPELVVGDVLEERLEDRRLDTLFLARIPGGVLEVESAVALPVLELVLLLADDLTLSPGEVPEVEPPKGDDLVASVLTGVEEPKGDNEIGTLRRGPVTFDACVIAALVPFGLTFAFESPSPDDPLLLELVSLDDPLDFCFEASISSNNLVSRVVSLPNVEIESIDLHNFSSIPCNWCFTSLPPPSVMLANSSASRRPG